MCSVMYIIFYVTLGFFLCLCGVLFFKLYRDALNNAHALKAAIEKVQSYSEGFSNPPDLVEALMLLSSIKIDI